MKSFTKQHTRSTGVLSQDYCFLVPADHSDLNSLEKGSNMYIDCSDEFELKFPELSRVELKGFLAELSRAGVFQFSS